jgi:perosamine synthetase
MTATTSEIGDVAQAIRRVLDGRLPAYLHEPRFEGNEAAYLNQCLQSTFVSSVGAFVDRFEVDLATYTGAKRAVVTVNGTAALHLALLLTGVQRGDEVLLPALTFIATANAVSYIGATPHFCDSDPVRLALDPDALDAHLHEIGERREDGTWNRQTGRRIAAIVPMHVFGIAADMSGLLAVAERWGLPVVEDAAESLGSFIGDRHTGTFGRLGVLSFNGNKVITTGGGGAILTNDDALADRAKHLSTTARIRTSDWVFEHDAVGFNYRMPNLNAALGCAQLEQLDDKLANKRTLVTQYEEALRGTAADLVLEPEGTRSNYWLIAIRLPEDTSLEARDGLLNSLAAEGVHCRPVWTLMHRLPMYEAAPRASLPHAEALERRILNIPSSPFLRA